VANVFISYARRDRDRVLALASGLESEGLSVWWDPNLVPGKRFRDIIATELEAADSVVVVWTAASIQSDYVQDEAEEARLRGVLVPITLEPVKPPAGFRQVQAADLSQWTGSAQHPEFRMLLTAVRALVDAARRDAEADVAAPRVVADAPKTSAAGTGAAAAAATTEAPSPPPRAAPAAPQAPPASQAPQAEPTPHPDVGFIPGVFDQFARPLVWVSAAIAIALSGAVVGFGLSGAAAAMVLWAGAMALTAIGAGVSQTGKTIVMTTSAGVTLIVAASAHSLPGLVSAILSGGAVFAVAAIVMVAIQGGRKARTSRTAMRAAYRHAKWIEQQARAQAHQARAQAYRTRRWERPDKPPHD
jgi:hypothetical protein